MPVGPVFCRRLLKSTKTAGRLREEELEVVSFVPLVEEAGEKDFATYKVI